jgi:integrase
MLNWAVSKRRIPYNPLESVSGVPFNEKRRNRRDLNEDEQRRLLEAGLSGSFRRAARMKANRPRKDGTYKQVEFSPEQTARLTAEGRRIRMFYFVLLETGLRVNEVRNLKWRDVDFRNQCLYCRDKWTKNRQDDVLPIAPELFGVLEKWRTETSGADDSPVVIVKSNALKILNDDLQAAGILKKDAAGRTVDLHALRNTFATMLNEGNADPKTMQALMRHSTPVLTLGTYVHQNQARMAKALKALPRLMPDESDKEGGQDDDPGNDSRMVGTDSFPVDTNSAVQPGNPTRNQQENWSNPHKLLNAKEIVKVGAVSHNPDVRGSNPLPGAGEPFSLHHAAIMIPSASAVESLDLVPCQP